MERVKGYFIYLPARPGFFRTSQNPDGKCLENEVQASGIYDPAAPWSSPLSPFFTKLYESCGISRRDQD
jgi:hypothetical protein